jgi:hypothetical protein
VKPSVSTVFDMREQAELQTRDYGFRVNVGSLRGVRCVVESVANRRRRPTAAPREFPEGLRPQVVVEGRRIVLDQKQRDVDEVKPQIMIFANGDLTSFEISLRREGGGAGARIYTDEQLAVRLLLPGEEEPKGPPVRTAQRP